MPFMTLKTNVAVNDSQTEPLLQALSQELVKQTGKPERYVMVAVEHNPAMLFAGTAQPLAYLECKSIGLTAAQAKALSAAIAKLLHTALQIPAERIYIEFSNCPGEFWGWNGGTF